MQIRALRTFGGRYGIIRTGIVVTVDDRYGYRLVVAGLAERLVMEPPLNMAHTEAPNQKGKEKRPLLSERAQQKKSDFRLGQPIGGGLIHRPTSSSRRRDHLSLKPT